MSDTVETVRRFNRFYTRFVGALDPRFLGTDLTLSEARLLLEIAHGERPAAADLVASLGMDRAYVSRVLKRFAARGWIERSRNEHDSRRRPITLTETGRAAFADLDARQRHQVEANVTRLGPVHAASLGDALSLARILLDPAPARRFTLRTFRPGDMGLIAARQSILYLTDYGWGPGIEVNIGEVTAAFLRNFRPGREQCWVAEVETVMAGSVFLTDEGDGLCRLRLLYVEGFARGLGVGRALVRTCIAFARDAGYRTMTLWTHTILEAARRIYAAEGFELVETRTHDTFGSPVQGETWRLDLARSPAPTVTASASRSGGPDPVPASA